MSIATFYDMNPHESIMNTSLTNENAMRLAENRTEWQKIRKPKPLKFANRLVHELICYVFLRYT